MSEPTMPLADADLMPLDAAEGGSETVTGLSDDEVQAKVKQALDAAKQHVENEFKTRREDAGDYYFGRPFGNEEQGRSQFVLTEVRDTVQAMLPSVMRVLCGVDRPVGFRPRGAEDVEVVEQATEVVTHIIYAENRGYLTLHAAFKDAMLRKVGVVKYWWENDHTQADPYTLTGLSQEQVQALATDTDVLVDGVFQREDGTFDANLRHLQTQDGHIVVSGVPPEEFVWTPGARSLQDALLVAHVTKLPRSDLLAMGIDKDVLDTAAVSNELSEEDAARQPNGTSTFGEQSPDPATDKVDYAECFVYLDVDGDGIAEHRRICLVGADGKLVVNEPFSGRPFALFFVDPEPHAMNALDIADATMDLQRVKSMIVRSTLDSLAQVVNPRTEAVVDQVNINDLMNPEIGGVVRVNAPGQLRELVATFVGDKTLPMLEFFNGVKEDRTGQSKAAMGLDADALQSTTRAAVAATISAAQQHLDLLCRMLAETGLRDLYAGVLRLLVQHQQRAMVIRLRGEYVEVDPRPWNAEMDTVVNVVVGQGTKEERLAALQGIAQKQEAILQLLGPQNDLVTLGQYSQTLAQLVKEAGRPDTERYFKLLPADYSPQPAPPKPTPEETYAAVEQMKVQADIAYKQEQLALQRAEAAAKEQRERDRMELDAFLRAMELHLKYKSEVNYDEIQRALAEARKQPSAPE